MPERELTEAEWLERELARLDGCEVDESPDVSETTQIVADAQNRVQLPPYADIEEEAHTRNRNVAAGVGATNVARGNEGVDDSHDYDFVTLTETPVDMCTTEGRWYRYNFTYDRPGSRGINTFGYGRTEEEARWYFYNKLISQGRTEIFNIRCSGSRNERDWMSIESNMREAGHPGALKRYFDEVGAEYIPF